MEPIIPLSIGTFICVPSRTEQNATAVSIILRRLPKNDQTPHTVLRKLLLTAIASTRHSGHELLMHPTKEYTCLLLLLLRVSVCPLPGLILPNYTKCSSLYMTKQRSPPSECSNPLCPCRSILLFFFVFFLIVLFFFIIFFMFFGVRPLRRSEILQRERTTIA